MLPFAALWPADCQRLGAFAANSACMTWKLELLRQLGLEQFGLQLKASGKAIAQTKSTNSCCQLHFVALTLQRALLERLTGLISTPVGDAVPAGVVALEAMRLIIEVVGEVSSDEVHRMRQPCITKLTAHPQPLQSQVGPLHAQHLCLEPITNTPALCETSLLCVTLSLPPHSSSAWNPCHCEAGLVAALPLRKPTWL